MSATCPELLVSLDKLPGFDPVGLSAICEGRVAIVLGPDSHHAGQWRWCSTLHGVAAQIPERRIALDLANSATRDRVARWLAERLGLHLGPIAPRWDEDLDGDGWWLDTGTHPPEMASFAPVERLMANLHVVPTLAALEGRTDMTLADGSLLVDALALAVVVVHLGQQVTP